MSLFKRLSGIAKSTPARGGGISRALPVGRGVPFRGPVRGRPTPPISIGGPSGGMFGNPLARMPVGDARARMPIGGPSEFDRNNPGFAIGRPVAPPTNIGRPPFTPPMGGAGLIQGGPVALPVAPPQTLERETGVIGRPVGLPMPKYETGLPQADDIVSALPVGPSIPFTPPDTNELPTARPLPVPPRRPNFSNELARPPVGPDGTIFSATPTPSNPTSVLRPYTGIQRPGLGLRPPGSRPQPPMSIGGPGGGTYKEFPTPGGGVRPPSLMPIGGGDQVVAGGTPGFDVTGGNPLAGAPGFSNTGVGTSQPADDTTGMATATGATAGATDPTVTATTTGTTDSMQAQMTQGAIDPVLLNQQASEVLGDPLLRSLYFGTADQPGFFNQLQQAGANLIGSDVPLQQTAGLSPLELLARQQAVAGLGGFEPFLQQNRRLINQAIQQSRRAEALQDPYYSQAEEIFQNTMGAYDPSMTQQFYNPFEDAVVQRTIDDVFEAGEQQDIAARAREIGSGAFGGSRARLGAMERREALGEGLAQALGNIRQRGFSEAQRTGLSEFARQQQARRLAAQGLLGIGTGRGSAAGALAQRLAGFGGQMTDLGRTQEQLRAGQRGELAGFGSIGRGIAETGLQRLYEQQLGQQLRPLQVLAQLAGMLPGYQGSRTQIDSQYGMPTDPTAAGLGAAFSAYGALAPRQGTS
jgi:hypothetical protein